MNREIKFRGKSTNTGKFIHGLFCYDWDSKGDLKPAIQSSLTGLENSFSKTIIDINTLSQFTGLLDKNGKEIYEGDILKEDSTTKMNLFKVWKERGGFVINQFQDDFKKPINKILFWEAVHDMQTIGYIATSCVVIGNIYENPELLK